MFWENLDWWKMVFDFVAAILQMFV